MRIVTQKNLADPYVVSMEELRKAMLDLTASEFKVLIAILSAETVPGSFLMHWKRLREMTGLSQKTVAKAAKELQKGGYINVYEDYKTAIAGWYKSSLMENINSEFLKIWHDHPKAARME